MLNLQKNINLNIIWLSIIFLISFPISSYSAPASETNPELATCSILPEGDGCSLPISLIPCEPTRGTGPLVPNNTAVPGNGPIDPDTNQPELTIIDQIERGLIQAETLVDADLAAAKAEIGLSTTDVMIMFRNIGEDPQDIIDFVMTLDFEDDIEIAGQAYSDFVNAWTSRLVNKFTDGFYNYNVELFLGFIPGEPPNPYPGNGGGYRYVNTDATVFQNQDDDPILRAQRYVDLPTLRRPVTANLLRLLYFSDFLDQCISPIVEVAYPDFDPDPNNPDPLGPGNPSTACGGAEAPLTGTFGGADPCTETADVRGLTFAQDNEGGAQFEEFITDWITSGGVPNGAADGHGIAENFKGHVNQVYTNIVDQTETIGQLFDADNQVKTQQVLEKLEVEAARRFRPSGLACQGGTVAPKLSLAAATASAVAQGITYDFAREDLGANNAISQDSLFAYQNERWVRYTEFFCNQAGNRSNSMCLNAAPAHPHLVNADINMEQLLLSDTINMSSAADIIGSVEVFRNLFLPEAGYTLSDNVINNSVAGQMDFLDRRNKFALRQVPIYVVGQMLGRRSSIIDTDTNAATAVNEIRTRAQIPAAEISADPSYNEIMLAMTKERFMDPAYFLHLNDDIGAIKQEQTNLDAYTSMTLQDIYDLQEQINTLMAVRAAIKLRQQPISDGREFQPK